MNHRLSGILSAVTENWQQRAKASCEVGTPKYDVLLLKAQGEVPAETVEQIENDVPRTFVALPEELHPTNEEEAQAALRRILLAVEWGTSTSAQSAGMGSTYTQGMNFLAAMCFVGVDEVEELAFWLFRDLLENILGLRFFAEWPPLLGFHALTAVAKKIAPVACPMLAGLLGAEFSDVVSLLGFKLFIPCYIGCIPAEPLVVLWNNLLCGNDNDFQRRPLLVWFICLLRDLERGICGAVKGQMEEYPDYPLAPFALRSTLLLIECITPDWKPTEISCPSGPELIQLSISEEGSILAEAQDRQLSKFCGIPHTLVTRLHQEFLKLPAGDGDGIDLGTLRRVLWQIAPRHVSEESSRRLFELLDRDGSGTLDFYELMTGIIVLCTGSCEKKINLLFTLYDTDRSGYLEKDELLCLAKALVNFTTSLTQHRRSPSSGGYSRDRFATSPESNVGKLDEDVPRHMKLRTSVGNIEQISNAEQLRRRLLLLDKSCEGRVSWEAFRTGAISDPLVGRCLASLGITQDMESHALPEHMLLRETIMNEI